MRRTPILIPLLCLALASCADGENGLDDSPIVSAEGAASSAPSTTEPVEPYPEELTVDHFRTMTLSGTDLTIGRVLGRSGQVTQRYITYRSNGVLISGTLSIPDGDGPFPLIVQNHGYIDPAVYSNGRGLRREQAALAAAGFAVLHTDYRKHAQSDPDPDLRNIYDNNLTYALDSVNAVLAVRELHDPRIDATKAGMLGHSMGGGVTLHVLVAHPELIDAAVLYAPVSADAWANFERWRMDGDDTEETFAAMGTKAENPEPWVALSQSGSFEHIDDPILLFHGLLDKDVPVEWSNDLYGTLDLMGKDIRYVTYPKEGHEFGPTWGHFRDQMIGFFRENVGKNEL